MSLYAALLYTVCVETMCACPRDPLTEPDPSRARVAAALAGPGWRLAQSSLAQAGGAGRETRTHLARTTCPRRHSANSWVNFQHLPSTLLPRLSPYYTCTSRLHNTHSHTAVRPSCRHGNMLDAERCLAIHRQWTMDSESQAPAGCMLVHQAKFISLVEAFSSPGGFAVRNRSLALRAIGSATACTTGSDSATRLPVCVRRLFVRLKRLFDRLK